MLLATKILEPTPATPISLIDVGAGAIAAFGIGEAGQRVSANIDKARAREFLTQCPKEWAAAMEQARKAVKSKFLGIF